MAVNFSDVRNVVIPEGTVKSIAVNGVVMWEAKAIWNDKTNLTWSECNSTTWADFQTYTTFNESNQA